MTTNIFEMLKDHGTFKTLVNAIRITGHELELRSKREFTIFAPIDNAFMDFSDATVETILGSDVSARNFVQSHMILKSFTYAELLASEQLKTRSDSLIKIKKNLVSLGLNVARFIETDIETANGLIHVIDSVLIPIDNSEEMIPRDLTIA